MLKSSLNTTNAMHICCKRSEVRLISSYLLGNDIMFVCLLSGTMSEARRVRAWLY